MNIGIPLGFSFGSGEDKTLYEQHFSAFAAQTGIKLSKFAIESDQGSALKAVCQGNCSVHLACLRHLLVSLRFSAFSYAAGEIIKCATLFELNNTLTSFAGEFEKIKTDTEIAELNKVLAKIGMEYKDKTINITDATRWEQVSILARIKHRMPSTTNSLEATHGHLNKKVPRNNNFWASINRLCESISLKCNNVNERIQQNYNYIKRTTIKRMKSLSQTSMEGQQGSYLTNKDHCYCNENKLVSAIMDIDIPCSHRCSLGATFPECPKIDIPLIKQWNELVVDYNIIPVSHDTHDYDENLGAKKYAVNIIKRFSCYTKKEEIEKYVNDNYTSDDEECYIDGKDVELIKLIFRGIKIFSDKKLEQKVEKGIHSKQ